MENIQPLLPPVLLMADILRDLCPSKQGHVLEALQNSNLGNLDNCSALVQGLKTIYIPELNL